MKGRESRTRTVSGKTSPGKNISKGSSALRKSLARPSGSSNVTSKRQEAPKSSKNNLNRKKKQDSDYHPRSHPVDQKKISSHSVISVIQPPQDVLPTKQIENVNSMPSHFLTVSELECPQTGHWMQTKEQAVKEKQSRGSYQRSPARQFWERKGWPSPLQIDRSLEETISRLRSRQETIQVLRKSLIGGEKELNRKGISRVGVLQVQLDFLVQKITEMEHQLGDKNRQIGKLKSKIEMQQLNMRKKQEAMKQNNRLKEEKALLEKQNRVLRRVFDRKYHM